MHHLMNLFIIFLSFFEKIEDIKEVTMMLTSLLSLDHSYVRWWPLGNIENELIWNFVIKRHFVLMA